jgi:hypothetical protein
MSLTRTRQVFAQRRLAVAALAFLMSAAPGLARTASAAAPDILTPIPLRTVSISSVSVTEPASGSRSAGVVATLHGEPLHAGESLTFHYHTEDGTATGGSDYEVVTDKSVRFFPNGGTSLPLDVSVLHDADNGEALEMFTVRGDRIGFFAPEGTVTIVPQGSGGGGGGGDCDPDTQRIVCL